MVHWPQLALWLNYPIEIISVTLVCGTPAWGFDRWECLLHHLPTSLRGILTKPTTHDDTDPPPPPTVCIGGTSVRWVARIFTGEKMKKREVWRKYIEVCEQKAKGQCLSSPIVFSLASCIRASGFKLFLYKAGTAHAPSVCKAYRQKELSAYNTNRWVFNMHEINIKQFQF